MPGIADVYQGWVLPDVAQTFFPFSAFDEAVEPTRRTIALDGLERSLARRLVECLDLLERSVAARALSPS